MNYDLTKKVIANANHHKQRVLHRYSVGDIWALLNGYLTPENWLRGEKKDFKNAFNIFQGTWKHKQIQSLMTEYEQEVKKEMKVGDITLVGMADLLAGDKGIEIKTSEKIHIKAKPWHEYQAKLYCILFDRPKWEIVQPIIDGGLKLKIIGTVYKDDKWFSKIMKKLQLFDKEIEEINKELDLARHEDEEAERWKEEDEDLEPERRAERAFEEEEKERQARVANLPELETNDIKEDLL